MDDETLIKLVQQFDVIYNKTNKDYKNKVVRENAWRTIASVLEDTAQNAENRWNVLRNRYNTERRKERAIQSGDEGPGFYTPWPYYEAMGFLEKYVVPRKTHGNVTSRNTESSATRLSWNSMDTILQASENITEVLSDDELDSTLIKENEMQILSDTSPLQTSSSTTPSSSRSNSALKIREETGILRRKKVRTSDNHQLAESINTAVASISNFFVTEKDNSSKKDEDALFADSIACALSKVESRKRKAQMKIELLQVIEKYEDN